MNEIERLVRRILTAAAIAALLAAGVGAPLAGIPFALGVLAGSVLACGSFLLMRRDLTRLLNQVATEGGPAFGGMLRLGLRSLSRLAVLALILILLAVKTAVHPIGLVLGLTTLPLGVVIAGLAGKTKRQFGIPD